MTDKLTQWEATARDYIDNKFADVEPLAVAEMTGRASVFRHYCHNSTIAHDLLAACERVKELEAENAKLQSQLNAERTIRRVGRGNPSK